MVPKSLPHNYLALTRIYKIISTQEAGTVCLYHHLSISVIHIYLGSFAHSAAAGEAAASEPRCVPARVYMFVDAEVRRQVPTRSDLIDFW